MFNRVTDQTTQNGLIKKFRLKGILPEMTVLKEIIPVVHVATLDDAQNVSKFEKWRSVFQGGPTLIDPAVQQQFAVGFITTVTRVAPLPQLTTAYAAMTTGTANLGVALPGGGVGVHATDGVYRITLTTYMQGGAIFAGSVHLVDQVAFGDPVALGTIRKTIGHWSSNPAHDGNFVVWDHFVKIFTTQQANSVVFDAPIGVNGSGALAIRVTKLIDEVPPNIVFS